MTGVPVRPGDATVARSDRAFGTNVLISVCSARFFLIGVGKIIKACRVGHAPYSPQTRRHGADVVARGCGTPREQAGYSLAKSTRAFPHCPGARGDFGIEWRVVARWARAAAVAVVGRCRGQTGPQFRADPVVCPAATPLCPRDSAPGTRAATAWVLVAPRRVLVLLLPRWSQGVPRAVRCCQDPRRSGGSPWSVVPCPQRGAVAALPGRKRWMCCSCDTAMRLIG